jgi:hypothetical protein
MRQFNRQGSKNTKKKFIPENWRTRGPGGFISRFEFSVQTPLISPCLRF